MALPAVIAGGAVVAAKTPAIRSTIVGLSNRFLGLLGLASVATPMLNPIDTLEDEKLMGMDKKKMPYYIGAAALAFMVLKK